MKIIEAMKQVVDLNRKQADLREKIALYCSHTTLDTPVYGDQTTETVEGWLQSHEDISQEIARLKVCIQRTNLATLVSIQLGGKVVKKSISEWIVRRGGKNKNGLASDDCKAWKCLSDRGLKDGHFRTSQDVPMEVKVVRNFDPRERDAKIALYQEEPMLIDATLEVVNATTDLIET
ncbi:MAG: hypothetical protein IT422_00685 [Pirellulaceae bacterium]|nr:hypothetical protein [Pirellulaceae bacterium]